MVEAEKPAHSYARRSIVAARPIPRGTMITRDMLTFKRPGTGVSPRDLALVTGRTAKQDISEDAVITWEML
jgi:N-acetylneuraminate synthase